MSDIYYSPKEFGLEIIWKAEANLGYEFDITAAWGSTLTSAVWLGRDSGCSCPTPFERITGLDAVNELERIDPWSDRAKVQATLAALMERDWSPWTDAERQQEASQGADAIMQWLSASRRAS